MLASGVAELPALGKMSEHGTGVLGFEFAATTDRLRSTLSDWGAPGRTAAKRSRHPAVAGTCGGERSPHLHPGDLCRPIRRRRRDRCATYAL
jgi:hypothetical protein